MSVSPLRLADCRREELASLFLPSKAEEMAVELAVAEARTLFVPPICFIAKRTAIFGSLVRMRLTARYTMLSAAIGTRIPAPIPTKKSAMFTELPLYGALAAAPTAVPASLIVCLPARVQMPTMMNSPPRTIRPNLSSVS